MGRRGVVWRRWALALAAGLALSGCGEPAVDAPGEAALELGAVMSADAEGFARVTGPPELDFPRDHGAHPDHRSEWWYFTGNLTGPEGRAFGFQLTFFRFALAPEAPDQDSPWATRQAWMAHFAVSDVDGRGFHAFQRLQRGAVGLAAAETRPVRVWLDHWEMRSESPGALFPLVLRASQDGVSLELRLTADKPRVLQGDAGYSRKGADPGNASAYYSYTRLAARGRLNLDGEDYQVTGGAWLDREWSTSALDPGLAGWDWLALQLADGRDLMLYRLRRQDGRPGRWSAGTLVGPEGDARRLGQGEFTMAPVERWRSPASGVSYPVGWRVRVPSAGLDLEVSPVLEDQELRFGFRYWEGAVRARRAGSGEDAGVGYLELTGYQAQP